MATYEDIQAEFEKAAAKSEGGSGFNQRRADRIARRERGELVYAKPEFGLGRAKDAIIEEIHTGIRSQIVGFGAITGGVERRGRSARKTRNEELTILQKKLGQDKYINRDEQQLQYTEFASKVLAASAAEWLKADPNFQVSSGWIEDQLRSLTQVGTQVLATAVGGYGLGAMYMGNFIVGSTYMNLKQQGVDDDRALIGAILNAAVQAPMEQIGISKVTKLWRPRQQAVRFFKELTELAGIEFATEYIQNIGPEQFFEIWATNPSDTTKEQLKKWEDRLQDSEVHAAAFKEGGHAALSAVLLGAPGAYRVSKTQQLEKKSIEEEIEEQVDPEEEVVPEPDKKKKDIMLVVAEHKEAKGIPLTEEEQAALDKAKEKAKPKPEKKKKKDEKKPKVEPKPVEETEETPTPEEDSPKKEKVDLDVLTKEEADTAAEIEQQQTDMMEDAENLAAKMEQEQIPPVKEEKKKEEPPKEKPKKQTSIEDLVKKQLEENETVYEDQPDTTEQEEQKTLDKLMTEATPEAMEALSSRFGGDDTITPPSTIVEGKPTITTPTPSSKDLLEVMAEEEGTDLDKLKERYSEFLETTETQEEVEGPSNLPISYSDMRQPVFIGTGKDKGKVIKGKKHKQFLGRGTGGHNKATRQDIDASHSALRKRTKGLQGFIGYPNKRGEMYSLKEIEENKIGSRKYMREDPNSPANKWRGDSGPYITEMNRKMRLEKAAADRFMKESEGAEDLTKEQYKDLLKISKRVKQAAWNRAAEIRRPQDFDDLYNGAMMEALTFIREGKKEADKFHAKNAVLKQAKKTGTKALVFSRYDQESGKAKEVVSARDVETAVKQEEAIEAIRTDMSDIENNAAELDVNFTFDHVQEGLQNIDTAINEVLDALSNPMQDSTLASRTLTELSKLKLRVQGTLIDPASPVRILSDVGEKGSPEFEAEKAIMLKERAKPKSIPYEHTGTVAAGVPTSEMKAPPGVDKTLGDNPMMQSLRDYVKEHNLPVKDKSKHRLLHKIRAFETEARGKAVSGTKVPPTEAEVAELRKEKGIFKTGTIPEERMKGQWRRSISTLKETAGKVAAGDRKSTPSKQEYLADIPDRVYGDKLSKQSSTDLAIEKRNREIHRERQGLPVKEYAPTTEEQAEERRVLKKARLKELVAPKVKQAKIKPKKVETKPKGKISLWNDTPAAPLPVTLRGTAKERAAKVTPEVLEKTAKANAVNTPQRKPRLSKVDREVLAIRQKLRGGKTLAQIEGEKEERREKKRKEPLPPDELDMMSVSESEMTKLLEGKDKATQDTLKAILGVEYDYKQTKLDEEEATPEEIAALDKAIEKGKEIPAPEPAKDLSAAHDRVLEDLKDSGPKLKADGTPKKTRFGDYVPWSKNDALKEVNAILAGTPSDRVTGTTVKAVEKAYRKTDLDKPITKKASILGNEKGSSPEVGEMANLLVDSIGWLDQRRKSVIDTFDVEAPWIRMGLNEVGRAFKNFFSVKTMHMDEGVQEAQHVADILKQSIPKPTARDWADVVLLYEDKSHKRAMMREDPARFEKLWPAADEFGKFFAQAEDMLKYRGIDNNPIDRMIAKAEERALNADTFTQQLKQIQRIDELLDTNYVHISLASLFKESLQDKINKQGYKKSKEAKKFLSLMTQKRRKALSIGELLSKHEDLDISMVDPIDIMLRYQNNFAKDMALLDIRDSLRAGGKLKSSGKKKPKNWTYLGRPYEVLQGNNVDPDVLDMINNLYKATEAGNRLTRTLSYIKMAAFFNPIFLPAYDMYQAAMSGVLFRNPVKYARNLAAGYRDVRTNNLAMKESQTAGTFSKPFEYPYASYFRNVKSIKNGVYWEGLGGKAATDIVTEWGEGGAIRAIGKTIALRPLYAASWNMAWSMDAMIRQATYRTLKDKGMSASEAGQLTAKFHGDYASVPAKTRQIMNTFLFTPTFKFAMGKLYYSMLKGSVQGAFNAARGKQVSKNQKAMMGSLLSTTAVTMAFDMLMDSLGYTTEGDDDWNWLNFGRRYKRKEDVKDEWGRPREIIFTWSNPGNLLQRYSQRITDAGRSIDQLGFPAAAFKVAKWDLHPAFTTYLNLRDNRDDKGNDIWSRFDDKPVMAIKQARYAVTRMIRAWDAAESMFDSDNPEGKKLAHEYIKKDMGHFSQLVTNPWISVASAYDRSVEGQRRKYRIQQLKSDFVRDQRKYRMKHKVSNSTWLKNYERRMKEEQRLHNEWNRKNE